MIIILLFVTTIATVIFLTVNTSDNTYKENKPYKSSHIKERQIILKDLNIDLDHLVIQSWMNDNYDELYTYVNYLSDKYNNFQNHSFKTTDGNLIEINEGDYGWRIDRNELTSLLKSALTSEEKKIEINVPFEYSSGTYRNVINGNYIEINLSKQIAYIYRNDELKYKSPIISGRGQYTTPTGAYSVDYKLRNIRITGEDYAVPVQFWIAFNEDIGLHDAAWRNEFGGNIYRYNGSHGCINLPLDVAEEFYKLSFPGMPVIVY